MSFDPERVAAETLTAEMALNPKPIRVFGDLRFHTDGDVLALAFPAPAHIYSVEDPGVLRHWDATTGQLRNTFFLSDLETSWAFSPNAKMLGSASDDVSLWDIASGRLVTTLRPPSWVSSMALREEAPLIATGHDDGLVRLWDPYSRRLIHELLGHEHPVSAVAFSPDGQRLASAGEGRIIRIFETATGRLQGTLIGHTDRIQALAWHPEGRWLVSAGWDRMARVWDTTAYEPVILLNTHADQLSALAFHPQGHPLATADSAHTIHLWDALGGKEIHRLEGHQEEIRCLAFSPDGKHFASAGADRVIHLWDANQGHSLLGLDRPAGRRTQLVVSPGGDRVASTCGGLELRVWHAASGKQCDRPDVSPPVEVIAGSPDGRWLAGGGPDKKVYLWDSGGKQQAVLVGQAGGVAALAFAPDSRVLASASATDGTVWLWDVATHEPILVIPVAADGCTVEALAFHPEGRILAVGGIDWLATGGSDGAVCLWDTCERGHLVTFNRGITGLAFHPSGKLLAGASLGQSISVWDMNARELAAELTGHDDNVVALVYSPDDRWLVSGGDDRALRRWDAATNEAAGVCVLDTPIKALAFSVDGRYLFTGNGNTTSYQLEFASLFEDAE